MCNTTCNNHLHEEYNVDYILNEQALDITIENVPCSHELNIYIVQDEEDDQCNCNKCSKCEPKKVSCRSLACQQLNDECSCKRNKKKVRKTTMVNVLENNLLRLEDKMNDGCADMHESIEDLEDNINKVYNELKDEESRAKQQEAFLHYGLDDAVTRAWYNPEDRKIHFYHKNPANCLNVNVHEGCDCDCCNACGCECKCNNDECQSDIPYTMDDDCNIIPMSRMEEELPFFIDCTDFLKDIFVSEAYIRDDEQDNPDKKHGPILVIKFKRTLEPEPTDYDDPDIEVEVDLSKIWKLENYYDKEQIDALLLEIYDYINSKIGQLSQQIQNVDNRVTNVDNKVNNVDSRVTNEVNNLNDTINNTKTELQEIINNLNFDPTVEDYHNICNYGEETVIAKVNNTNITVKMPDAIDPSQFQTTVTNLDPTLSTESKTIATVGNTSITAKIPNVVKTIGKLGSATGDREVLIVTPLTGEPYLIELPQPADQGIDFDHYVTGATIDNNNVLHIQQNGNLQDVTVQLPAPGEGADGNDYVVSGIVNNNNQLVLTRKDGGTVDPIQLPSQPKQITNITQEGDKVTFTWSDNTTTQINVGGACVWKEEGDHVIPVNAGMKVHGAGFYDTTVS